MNESGRLADQIGRALDGDAWHGLSWRELLEGVHRAAATQRPVSGGHTIGEIVMHAGTWHDVVRRRLLGETPEVSDDQDWPKAEFRTDDEWKAAVTRLFESGHALRDTVASFPAERLHEKRPQVDQTWYAVAIGILQHDLYHAGQVGLLRKAVAVETTNA